MSDYLKLYIAVLEDVPDHMVPVLVAHSILGAHFKFTGLMLADDRYHMWLSGSFRKVVVRVTPKEFMTIIEDHLCYLGHENTVNDGSDSCVIPLPVWRNDVPPVLKFAKLWKPNNGNI